MKSNPLYNAPVGKSSLKALSANSRGIDLSRYSWPGLNFDQVIPTISQKLIYTGFQLEHSAVSALRPLLKAGIHNLARCFEHGEDMQLLMLPAHEGVTAYGVLKNGHPLSQVYACPMKDHAKVAWATVRQDQRLRQNLTYPVAYPQETLDFCRIAAQLTAPAGPFLTHHVLPGHFEYPELLEDLLAFEAQLFCVLSLTEDSRAPGCN